MFCHFSMKGLRKAEPSRPVHSQGAAIPLTAKG
jgi:hypothetical protein